VTRERLAKKIARSIFTAGNGTKAGTCALFKNNQHLGGWSEECMADHIAHMLPRPRRVRRVRAWGALGANGQVLTACINRVDAEFVNTTTKAPLIPVTITYEAPKKGKP
jgi:hypothetical protein